MALSFLYVAVRALLGALVEVIVNLIGATTTRRGLEVYARLDESEYPKGIAVSDAELAAINLKGDDFHPDWNYTIKPQVDR